MRRTRHKMRSRSEMTCEVKVLPLGQLTFVYYPEPVCGGVAAHCLELDMGGQGVDRASAAEDLQAAIEVYLEHLAEHREPLEPRCAPEEFQRIEDRETFCLQVVRVEFKKRKRSVREVIFSQPPERFEPRCALLA